MTTAKAQQTNGTAAIIFAVFAIVAPVAFLAYRANDIGRLGQLVAELGGGPLAGFGGLRDSISGLLIALIIVFCWYCVGSAVSYFAGWPSNVLRWLDIAIKTTIGAAAYSLIWFFLGLVGLYNVYAALLTTVIGLAVGAYVLTRPKREVNDPPSDPWTTFDRVLITLIGIPVVLALIGALAPPIAKDTLLYHFALPKAFIAQHSNAYVEGNTASYYTLGVEVLYVWPILLGRAVSDRAAEAAAGAIGFAFFPLLLIVVSGWARQIGISKRWSLMATVLVATIPTAYHVASSGYIDLALTLVVTLAIYAFAQWWKTGEVAFAILVGVFLGTALSFKLTAVFVVAACALLILVKARASERAGQIIARGFGALVLAGLIASPWYLRTWISTGSPVFPFYMSIWPGKASGWDVERSNLFQAMNAQYGGVDTNKLNLVTNPVRLSIMAQPEQPEYYDGVLGVAFLIGLPLLIWALWKFDLPIDVKIGSGIAAIIYLFWLFSSEQLRYLLPALAVLPIAFATSVEAITVSGDKLRQVLKYSFITASILGVLTSFAWFCQRAPLRIVLGGESRDAYLSRDLDYYGYYQELNSNTAPDSRVWLINMRRDTYYLERGAMADYIFEDWTLRRMLWETRSLEELRARAASMNVQYVLTRHDFLFDYDRTSLVDDKRPRAENEVKLKIAKDFLLDPKRTIRADDKFSLIKVF